MDMVEDYIGAIQNLSHGFWEHDRYHKDHVEVAESAEVALNLEEAVKLVEALKAFPPKLDPSPPVYPLPPRALKGEREEPESELNSRKGGGPLLMRRRGVRPRQRNSVNLQDLGGPW